MPKRRLFMRQNSIRSDRGIEYAISAPPLSVASINDMRGQTKLSRPLNGGERFTKVSNLNIYSGVVKLLASCSPSTVAGFVIAVVVDAIQGIFRGRPVSYVGIEVLKFLPPFANGDSSSAIEPIADVRRLQAARDHAAPNSVDVVAGFAVGSVPVTKDFPNHLMMEAPAGCGLPLTERLPNYLLFGSTIALTEPFRISFWLNGRPAYHNKATKSFASEVYRLCHESIGGVNMVICQGNRA